MRDIQKKTMSGETVRACGVGAACSVCGLMSANPPFVRGERNYCSAECLDDWLDAEDDGRIERGLRCHLCQSSDSIMGRCAQCGEVYCSRCTVPERQEICYGCMPVCRGCGGDILDGDITRDVHYCGRDCREAHQIALNDKAQEKIGEPIEAA
jgi:hypothetical protein